MKKIYWTAYKSHPFLMTLLSLVSLICLLIVEYNKEVVNGADYDLKLYTVAVTQKAFDAIKKQRVSLGYTINSKNDPANTGLIGKKDSSITSDKGVLSSKQISLNPNIAALLVTYLRDLNIKKGDTVAVGMTGSFPALDIITLSVLQTMEINAIVIVNLSSSQWGANLPGFTIADMVNNLNTQGIIKTKILAGSIGAGKDLGTTLDASGREVIQATLKRYKIPLIKEKTVKKSIKRRMDLYYKAAGDNYIKAYINIGGGVASIGKHYVSNALSKQQKEAIHNKSLHAGINKQLPIALANSNSVAVKFLKEGVPVINLKNINSIALKYNLKPWRDWMPTGVGPLYQHEKYNFWYAFISLFIIIGACFLEMRIQLRQKKHDAEEHIL